MPSYTYRCRNCQHVESVIQVLNTAFNPACPACGGLTEKIIGQVPTVLKHSHAQPENPDPAEVSTHECGSACVLHKHHPPISEQ